MSIKKSFSIHPRNSKVISILSEQNNISDYICRAIIHYYDNNQNDKLDDSIIEEKVLKIILGLNINNLVTNESSTKTEETINSEPFIDNDTETDKALEDILDEY